MLCPEHLGATGLERLYHTRCIQGEIAVFLDNQLVVGLFLKADEAMWLLGLARNNDRCVAYAVLPSANHKYFGGIGGSSSNP